MDEAAPKIRVKRGDVLELVIEKLVYGGKGLARVGGPAGFVVFVERVAPGDRVSARVFKKKRHHAEAYPLEILEPGPGRREPPCPVFGRCGGCSWQHLDDALQTRFKADQVRDALREQPALRDLPDDFFRPPVAAPAPFHYRNKLDYSFGTDSDREPGIGFHLRGNFRRIVPVPGCLIHPEPFDGLLDVVREWMAEHPEILVPYDKVSHTGLLRSFIARRSHTTGESIGVILTNGDAQLPGGGAEGLGRRIAERVPGFKGLIHGHNSLFADFAQMEREVERWGEDNFIERLGDCEFAVSAFSFFQTNTAAAELLYGVVRREARLDAESVLFDAYCGTGSIGIFCGRDVRRLYGIDIVPEAIDDARRNAERNGLGDRAHFWAGDVRDRLPDLREHLAGQGGSDRLTHLVIDPPRGGMHKKALRELLELRARRLVYVSCNPTTMARDCEHILAAGYRPESVTAVDLFPQTYHIEAVMPFELAE